MYQEIITISTPGRGAQDITEEIQDVVSHSDISTGLCHVFIQHTSASLIVCENAAPEVLLDLEFFMSRIVPDGDPAYRHSDEGPDDMPAHIRTILTHTALTLPVTNSDCALGIWQGIFLWEHRHRPHTRNIIITVHS